MAHDETYVAHDETYVAHDGLHVTHGGTYVLCYDELYALYRPTAKIEELSGVFSSGILLYLLLASRYIVIKILLQQYIVYTK